MALCGSRIERISATISGVGGGTSSDVIAPWSIRSRIQSGWGEPARASRTAGNRIFSSMAMCRRIPARNSSNAATSSAPGRRTARVSSASSRSWSAARNLAMGPPSVGFCPVTGLASAMVVMTGPGRRRLRRDGVARVLRAHGAGVLGAVPRVLRAGGRRVDALGPVDERDVGGHPAAPRRDVVRRRAHRLQARDVELQAGTDRLDQQLLELLRLSPRDRVLPQPEKDLERPSSTRLEARFPYCREPAYCMLSAYCILHIECSTFHSIIFQDLE